MLSVSVPTPSAANSANINATSEVAGETATPSSTATSEVAGETATPSSTGQTASPGTSSALSSTPTISSTQTQSAGRNSTTQSVSSRISFGNGTSSGYATSPSSGIPSNNGISNGALAGAVVGSIAGTAILTFLLAYLFYRRRQNSTIIRAAENESDFSQKTGALGRVKAVPVDTQSSFSLTAITPHPADDKTVHNRILTLIDHATLHVDSFYASTAPAGQLSPAAIGLLEKYNSPFLPEPLVAILQGRRGNARQAIAHALVYTLLTEIQPGGQLIPPAFAAQPAPQTDSSSALYDEAFFSWRMTTAYLYNHSAKSNTDPARASAQTQAAQSLAGNFTLAFAPYALSEFPENDRTIHLANLAISTAELGVWLFSQPCTFEFVWQHAQAEINVAPEVRKTCDEHGVRLATPQILSEAF